MQVNEWCHCIDYLVIYNHFYVPRTISDRNQRNALALYALSLPETTQTNQVQLRLINK